VRNLRADSLSSTTVAEQHEQDDDFILILITCKYAHFWDFTIYAMHFVMLEDVTYT